MTQQYKIFGVALASVLLLLTVLVFFVSPVSANPATLQRVTTAAATSTLAYMTTGAGTTTLTLLNSTGNIAYDSAQINVLVTATSTGIVGAVTLNARIEGSMDDATNPGLMTWYPLDIAANTTLGTSPNTASTTLITSNPYNQTQLVLSTSTLSFGGTGTAFVIPASFPVPNVPLKHIRVVFTDPASGGNYGIYAELVAKKQNP